MEQRRKEGAEVCSLSVGFQIHQTFSGLIDPVQFQQTSAIHEVEEAARGISWSSGPCLFCMSDEGSGWPDFLERQFPTIQEVVAAYLVDGKVEGVGKEANFLLHILQSAIPLDEAPDRPSDLS